MLYNNPVASDGFGFIIDVDAEILSIQAYRLKDPMENAGVDGETVSPALAGLELGGVGPVKTISLSTLKGTNQWFDHSNWVFEVDRLSMEVDEGRNLYANTSLSHETPQQFLRFTDKRVAAFLTVPHVEADFLSCGLTLVTDARCPVPANVDVVAFDKAQHHRTFPEIALVSPGTIAPDATGVFTLTARTAGGDDYPYPLEVYLETTAGYLPKQRVVVNGAATFKLSALGLDTGDSIKVKAGFRHYSGKAEAIVEVS